MVLRLRCNKSGTTLAGSAIRYAWNGTVIFFGAYIFQITYINKTNVIGRYLHRRDSSSIRFEELYTLEYKARVVLPRRNL